MKTPNIIENFTVKHEKIIHCGNGFPIITDEQIIAVMAKCNVDEFGLRPPGNYRFVVGPTKEFKLAVSICCDYLSHTRLISKSDKCCEFYRKRVKRKYPQYQITEGAFVVACLMMGCKLKTQGVHTLANFSKPPASYDDAEPETPTYLIGRPQFSKHDAMRNKIWREDNWC